MLLEPGPLPKLNTSWYPTTYDTPDFETNVNDWWTSADLIVGEMDGWIPPDLTIDDALTGDTIMTDLDNVDKSNGDNAASINLSGIQTGDGMKANGDAALVAANQAIPGEAWTPVPATTPYGSVPQTQPTARIAGVALANLSGGNPQIYTQGDQYQLVVHMDTGTGAVADYYNVHVFAVRTLDGRTQPNLEIGHTDHTGVVVLTGQWQPADVGNWTMYVHADPTTGGDVVSILYSWNVGAANRQPIGPTQPAVTVQLHNLTTGVNTFNHSGDSWQLLVTGPPNSPVYIFATHDGQALAEVEIGGTDGNGNFVLNGAWGDGDVGQWAENYVVGRFAWPGQLNFTVQPAAAAATGPGGTLPP